VCAFEEEIIFFLKHFQNTTVFEQSKPASLCHCLLVVCRIGSLAHAMKKSKDLHDII
jgi:hypothetical protein